jgi:hypothetical protein
MSENRLQGIAANANEVKIVCMEPLQTENGPKICIYYDQIRGVEKKTIKLQTREPMAESV